MSQEEHKLANTLSKAHFNTNIFSILLIKTTLLQEVNESESLTITQ